MLTCLLRTNRVKPITQDPDLIEYKRESHFNATSTVSLTSSLHTDA